MPGMHQAGLQVAVDGVIFDQAIQAGLGVFGHVPQLAGGVGAENFGYLLRIYALAGMDLSAIAAGCT